MKPAKNVNLAYGFAALLIPPCQPDHLLLSLECYWLLPEPKEFYAQLKCKTSIKEGIKSGDIPKILEIVKENRTIWQECGAGYVEWLEDWIKARKNNW